MKPYLRSLPILALLLAWPLVPSSAQEPAPQKVKVALSGTGTADYLQTALDDLTDFLSVKGVKVKQLEGQPRSRTSSLEELRRAGGDSLVYITVELVMGTRARLKVQCFDVEGKQLWEENSGAGGFSLGGALKKLLKTAKQKMEPHIGQPGLPKS
jgi:hypothetical protein